MSTQTDLDEFDRPKRPAKGGLADSDRPRCGVSDTFDGRECKNVAIPALGVCHKHIDSVVDDESETDSKDKPVWERQ